jgi:hypothetical protein
MKCGIEISKMTIESDVSARVFEVDDIPIAKRRDFDSMHPSFGCCIDGLSFYSPKFVIQARMKVVGTKFREVARKVITSPWLYG